MSDGFRVDPAALRSARDGINQLVTELAEMCGGGGLVGTVFARNGRGLAERTLTDAPRLGGTNIAGALIAFGQRWEEGNRHLVEGGLRAAEELGEIADTYQRHDEDAAAELQRILHGKA
ncbi:hypothetical protein MOQ72_37230 [Saccharopolyspora sp. K220]|uniref:hypothetical protein n=1 Tax=Saccharopolyspora soli TaxID=2926618 RepID=UPI001F57D7FA|nr:hypothetical protein [Saccharopolyspora soli]MCI2423076.1 hypothetical protein [Saccharopolyspora soli]